MKIGVGKAILAFILGLIALDVIDTIVVTAGGPSPRLTYLQAVERDDRLWIFQEVDLYTRRGFLSFSHGSLETHAIYVFQIDANGVQQRHCLPSEYFPWGYRQRLEPNKVRVAGFGEHPCVYLPEGGYVLIWEDGGFRPTKPGEIEKVLQGFSEFKGDVSRLTVDDLDEIGEAAGWTIVDRGSAPYAKPLVAIDGRVEVLISEDWRDRNRLVVRGKGPPAWESTLVDPREIALPGE